MLPLRLSQHGADRHYKTTADQAMREDRVCSSYPIRRNKAQDQVAQSLRQPDEVWEEAHSRLREAMDQVADE